MTDSRLRVGIVGTSWWTDSMFLPALASHRDARVVALCGRRAGPARDLASRWDVEHVFTDPHEMIRSGQVDAVIVASANDSHHPVTMDALDHHLHVLCEKPIGLDAAQADEMAARADEVGVTTMVPFTYHYMPTNRWLKRLVDDGYLGRHFHVNMRYTSGYARDGRYTWRHDRELAGSGVIGDLGSHWLHLARWLFGEIEAIGALAARLTPPGARPDGAPYEATEDSAAMTVRFTSGAYGVLHVSAVCWEGTELGQMHHLVAHGEDGTLESTVDWSTRQEVRGVKAGVTGPVDVLPIPDDIWAGVRRESVHDTYRDVFRTTESMARAWVSAAVAGRPVQPDLAEGARIQTLVDAAVASSAAGGALIDV